MDSEFLTAAAHMLGLAIDVSDGYLYVSVNQEGVKIHRFSLVDGALQRMTAEQWIQFLNGVKNAACSTE